MQNRCLFLIANAHGYTTNNDIQRDLKLVEEEVQLYATRHEERILSHPNTETL